MYANVINALHLYRNNDVKSIKNIFYIKILNVEREMKEWTKTLTIKLKITFFYEIISILCNDSIMVPIITRTWIIRMHNVSIIINITRELHRLFYLRPVINNTIILIWNYLNLSLLTIHKLNNVILAWLLYLLNNIYYEKAF